MHSKQQIQSQLRALLESDSTIVAAWEGGSKATGFEDEFSDLDLAIVVEDEALESVMSKVNDFLETQYGIQALYRIPEPAWHGFSQLFIQLKDTHPLFYLDLAFIKKSQPNKLTESDRHGQAYVYFDKEQLYDPTPSSTSEIEKRAKQFYHMATASSFLLRLEIKKQLARKRLLEAYPMVLGFVQRNLAILWNLKYRPQKVDFGLRYGYRDYPLEIQEWLVRIYQAGSIERLQELFPLLEQHFLDLEKELARIYQTQ